MHGTNVPAPISTQSQHAGNSDVRCGDRPAHASVLGGDVVARGPHDALGVGDGVVADGPHDALGVDDGEGEPRLYS